MPLRAALLAALALAAAAAPAARAAAARQGPAPSPSARARPPVSFSELLARAPGARRYGPRAPEGAMRARGWALAGTAGVGAATKAADVVIVSGQKSSYKLIVGADVPRAPRAAVGRALETWSKVFPCAVEIRVSLTWEDLEEFGALGAAVNTVFIPGSVDGADKLDNGTMYSPVVAAAIEGKDFVPEDQVHIVMIFNSEIPWNTGTAPAKISQWDLESTALHELGHGLFFFDTAHISASQKIADFSFRNSRPSRFGRFLSTGPTKAAAGLASCTKPSSIYGELTSNSLRFIDPSDSNGTNFGLYSPVIFMYGSSVSHTDEDTLFDDCRAAGIKMKDCSGVMNHRLANGYTERTVGVPVERMMNAILGNSTGFYAADGCSRP